MLHLYVFLYLYKKITYTFGSNTNRLISSFPNDLTQNSAIGSLVGSNLQRMVYPLTRALKPTTIPVRSRFVDYTARFTLTIQSSVVTVTVQLNLLCRLSHVVIKCYAVVSLIKWHRMKSRSNAARTVIELNDRNCLKKEKTIITTRLRIFMHLWEL